MARMIPVQIFSGNPSFGEKEIFHRLANDPDTKNWCVLHSLDIADHMKRLAGEVDFVIIVPQMGVLCLEVKAASSVKRVRGVWYYGSNPKPDPRGPFKQASEALHSIRKRLIGNNRGLAKIPVWSAVIFPYLEFGIKSGEWHPWQVIDSIGFRKRPIGSLVLDVLSEARNFLAAKEVSWFDETKAEPDKFQCEQIAKILRPDFEVYEPPRIIVQRLDQDVKKYTEEQFVALDAMEANPRVIYSGPAGTGKTFLAIEATRRSRATGKRVLFLCFNRLLGNHLEKETAALQPEVTAGTLHKYMLVVAGATIQGDNPPDDYWEETLPQLAIESLLGDETGRFVYDEIIVDETQDLLRANYLDFLDLSVKGGLSAGEWKLFGDFEKQAIYGAKADLEIAEARSSRFGNAPQYSLRVNCRNTPRIASLVHLLGGLAPEYSNVLRPDDGVEPEIIYYLDSEDQKDRLLRAFQSLKQNGFTNPDIVVLSTKSSRNAIAGQLGAAQGIGFAGLGIASKTQIGFGSIHAYKGMESPAVVVTDVDSITGPLANSLFYIAMTRAKHRLIILAHQAVKGDVLEEVARI